MARKSPTVKKIESDGQDFSTSIGEFEEFVPGIQITKEEDVKDTFTKPNPPNSSSAPSNALSSEVNPFERSFDKPYNPSGPSDGNGIVNGISNGTTTPGGTKLPGIHELTSPSGLNGSLTPSFWRGVNTNGLRSGPLSPSMLSGPQSDYFGMAPNYPPTPNESGLRSGLSPGGSGSMFPEPSPNTLHSFDNFGDQSVVTPGQRSFQETAYRQQMMRRALAQQQATSHPSIDQALDQTSQAPHTMGGMQNGLTAMDMKPQESYPPQEAETSAVNGLFLLSQSQGNPTYSMAPQTTQHAHAHPPNMQVDRESHLGHRPQASISTQGDSPDMPDQSDDEPQSKKRKTRATAAKKTNNKPAQANGTQKKAPPKGGAKKSKVTNMSASPEPEQEELDLTKVEYDANGKPCNDEEKRKNFLERNRVAALKCRQRKKQWLANLQSKVEAYAAENEGLTAQMQPLKDEIVSLKTILLAHKECTVSHQQGLAGPAMHQLLAQGYNPAHPLDTQMNPYGMAMTQQQVNQQQAAMMAAGGPRRYS